LGYYSLGSFPSEFRFKKWFHQIDLFLFECGGMLGFSYIPFIYNRLKKIRNDNKCKMQNFNVNLERKKKQRTQGRIERKSALLIID
jgi:hypothetical protein